MPLLLIFFASLREKSTNNCRRFADYFTQRGQVSKAMPLLLIFFASLREIICRPQKKAPRLHGALVKAYERQFIRIRTN